MTKQFFAVLTHYGTQTIASAVANKQPLKITHMAVGDGNGSAVVPTAAQTKLTKEVYRSTISAVSVDPRNNKQVIFELTIPETVGGFYVREMGIFDSNNKLVAIANCPESYKPALASGSGKVQVLRMILTVSTSDAITLTVDDTVIFVTRGQLTPQTITATSANGFDNNGHTHEIDKADTTKAGIVQLTSDTGLDSEKLALTARAGRKLAQLIASIQQALHNYIPLNNRSSAVNSTSTENVATSAAAKTAYDKGVEAKSAADNAQRTANSANNNANSRVSKNGDTMTGHLHVKNGDYSSLRTYNQSGYGVRWESAPESANNIAAIVQTDPNDKVIYKYLIPSKSGTAALLEDLSWGNLRGIPNTASRWPAWNEVTSKPSTFPPSSHNHAWTQITNAPATATRWPAWSEVTSKPTTIAGYGIADFIVKNLGTEDLDKITTVGLYGQAANANTASQRHYPENQAGSLIVTLSAYGVQQEYTTYGSKNKYVRGRNENAWTAWKRIDGSDWNEIRSKPSTFPPSSHNHAWTQITNAPATATRWPTWSEVTSKPSTFPPSSHNHAWTQITNAPATATRWPTWNEVSGKPQVVQDVRLGATVSRKLENKEWQTHGAGYVVTGFYNYSDDLHANDWVYVKPIQKNINGTWVTVANA
ncbi:phage tail protein [Necropsobacter rosorum]|uniref:phage tail-collar fiber domain-containing protein n=1 Tax=Necropsobacter rosorum TaxID=908285 RepID=UPI000A00FCBB